MQARSQRAGVFYNGETSTYNLTREQEQVAAVQMQIYRLIEFFFEIQDDHRLTLMLKM